MKKTVACAAALLTLCALAFGKAPKEPVDVYDDGTQTAQEQEQSAGKNKKKAQKETKIKWNTKKNREAAMQGDPYNKKKMIGNRTFGDRLLNINKFTKIEAFSVFLRPTVGKLFSRKAYLIYREGTDIAGFEMYYDSSAYALQFATAARSVVISAIQRYYQDFDEKRLDRSAKPKKTREVYGFCDAYEDYGIISGMMTNYSRPRVFFGYMFIKNTPYFTINVKKSKNLAYGDSQSEEAMIKSEVIEQTYFFTKAQAKKLMTFLDDANISALQTATTEDAVEYAADSYENSDQADAETKPAQSEQAPAQTNAEAKPAQTEQTEQTEGQTDGAETKPAQ